MVGKGKKKGVSSRTHTIAILGILGAIQLIWGETLPTRWRKKGGRIVTRDNKVRTDGSTGCRRRNTKRSGGTVIWGLQRRERKREGGRYCCEGSRGGGINNWEGGEKAAVILMLGYPPIPGTVDPGWLNGENFAKGGKPQAHLTSISE